MVIDQFAQVVGPSIPNLIRHQATIYQQHFRGSVLAHQFAALQGDWFTEPKN